MKEARLVNTRRIASVFRGSMLAASILLTLLAGLATPARAAQPLTLFDLDGAKHLPLTENVGRVSVFFFLAHDCPISNGYAPEMNRIRAEYSARGVAFAVVYTDSDADAKTERAHALAFGFRAPELRDPGHVLVQRLGVTTTPEVAVLASGSGGKLLYRGRIDNTYARVGIRRTQTTEHDLRDALDAILQKRPVPHPTTQAVGCFIPTND